MVAHLTEFAQKRKPAALWDSPVETGCSFSVIEFGGPPGQALDTIGDRRMSGE